MWKKLDFFNDCQLWPLLWQRLLQYVACKTCVKQRDTVREYVLCGSYYKGIINKTKNLWSYSHQEQLNIKNKRRKLLVMTLSLQLGLPTSTFSLLLEKTQKAMQGILWDWVLQPHPPPPSSSNRYYSIFSIRSRFLFVADISHWFKILGYFIFYKINHFKLTLIYNYSVIEKSRNG